MSPALAADSSGPTADPVRASHRRLSGVFNFRDLTAALPTGVLTPKRLYRADGLHRSRPEERIAVPRLGIGLVVDLRSPAEVERDGQFSARGVSVASIPVVTDLAELFRAEVDQAEVDQGGAEDVLLAHYLHIAEHSAESIRIVLQVLATSLERRIPAVFHCAAGKDRTGVVAALILSGMGFGDAVVAGDYARSAGPMTEMVAWLAANQTDASPAQRLAAMGMPEGVDVDALRRRMLAADEATMRAFLRTLRQRHGSLAGYLSDIDARDAITTIGYHLVHR